MTTDSLHPSTWDGTTPTTTTAVDGRRLAYAAYGPPDGTPVVFFHGTPGSRRLAALFDSAAHERGLRLLAPDRPGFGQSAPWPDRAVDDAGRVVAAVLDDAGVGSAGLVAFSGGAPHALAAAATRPGRVERVDLVAGATPPDCGPSPPAVQRLLGGLATRAPVLLRGLLRGQAWLAGRLGPALVVGGYADDPGAVPDDVAEVVREDFVEAVGATRRGAVTEFRHATAPWPFSLDAVAAPVVLWHGDADTNVPVAGARRLASRLPTATLRVRDGADHLRTLLRCTPDALDGHARRGAGGDGAADNLGRGVAQL
ncbi:MAG: alpha/beta hydrolase [Haloferacaceae archaeon]